MAMITCRECGQPVSTEASACPQCGASPRTRARKWAWVPLGLLGAAVAFLGFGALISNTPEGEERSRKRAAIELCWKEQERKSLAPGEARFIAGACETMERDFLQKFGVRP